MQQYVSALTHPACSAFALFAITCLYPLALRDNFTSVSGVFYAFASFQHARSTPTHTPTQTVEPLKAKHQAGYKVYE